MNRNQVFSHQTFSLSTLISFQSYCSESKSLIPLEIDRSFTRIVTGSSLQTPDRRINSTTWKQNRLSQVMPVAVDSPQWWYFWRCHKKKRKKTNKGETHQRYGVWHYRTTIQFKHVFRLLLPHNLWWFLEKKMSSRKTREKGGNSANKKKRTWPGRIPHVQGIILRRKYLKQ